MNVIKTPDDMSETVLRRDNPLFFSVSSITLTSKNSQLNNE